MEKGSGFVRGVICSGPRTAVLNVVVAWHVFGDDGDVVAIAGEVEGGG